MHNSMILNTHVVNYSSLVEKEGLILHTTVGIGYETPWRQVEAMPLHGGRTDARVAARPAAVRLPKGAGRFRRHLRVKRPHGPAAEEPPDVYGAAPEYPNTACRS